MKILDISQSQNMYITLGSQENGEDKSARQKKSFEKMPEAEVVISQEGLVAWAEEIKKRTGNVGMLTGWEDPGKYAVGIANDVKDEENIVNVKQKLIDAASLFVSQYKEFGLSRLNLQVL